MTHDTRTLSTPTLRRAAAAVAALALLVALPLAAQPAEPQTEEQKTLYALGLVLAQNLSRFSITAEDLPYVQRGMTDAILGNEVLIDIQEYGPKLQSFAQDRVSEAASAEKEAGAAFLAEQATLEGAEQKESGLIFTEIEAGDGPSPSAEDSVTVHYTGMLRDGTVFDSSVERGEPVTFALGQVIPCWIEGLQMMQVGGKAKLVCPPSIAYGDQGRPPTIPGGATLVFDVELLGIGGGDEAAPTEGE